MIHLMIQLLKFDIKLLEYDKIIKNNNNNKNEIGNKRISDIDLIAKYKNRLIFFEVKSITNNGNSNKHNYISTQIQNQLNYIGLTNINYVLFIKGNKLLETTENSIKNLNPNITIIYNKISILPELKYDEKIIMLSQGTLGFIVSYHNTEFIFNKLWNKFSKMIPCVYYIYYDVFDKRMMNSKNSIEQNRWNKIKSHIVLIYEDDLKLCNTENLFDTFCDIKKKYINYIKYIWMNNFMYIEKKGENINTINNISDYIYIKHFKTLGIFGCKQDIEFKKKYLIIRIFNIIWYYIYIIYFIYFVKLNK